ncbi:MAG: Mu transposase C-terminal domain-containing protein [Thermodesulfobacteriota bacterium]|nr:Mu transposase C-terminal domain-containing protein [Thermodesulfobacteriota bacterium]
MPALNKGHAAIAQLPDFLPSRFPCTLKDVEDVVVEAQKHKENDPSLSVSQVIKQAQKQNLIDENQELSESIAYRLLSNRGLMDKRKRVEPGGKDHRRFPEPGVDLDEIFLAEDKRKVHKDSTISLHGKAYEAEAALVGETVILRYDPTASGQPIQVWFKGNRYDDAKLVDTLANCYVRRERPDETLAAMEKLESDISTKHINKIKCKGRQGQYEFQPIQ